MECLASFERDIDALPRRYRIVRTRPDTVALYAQDRPGQAWTFGHARHVPDGMTSATAAELMRRFVLEQIDHDEYRAAFVAEVVDDIETRS